MMMEGFLISAVSKFAFIGRTGDHLVIAVIS